MNAITKAGAVRLPDAISLPQPSMQLANAAYGSSYWVHEWPFGAADYYADRMPAEATIAEARQILRVLDQALSPPDDDVVRSWLMPLVGAVRNPPSQADFEARLDSLLLITVDLPVIAFNRATQREALATFKFWPAAADISELLTERTWPQRKLRDQLFRVVNVKPMSEREKALQRHEDARRAVETGRAAPALRAVSPMTGTW